MTPDQLASLIRAVHPNAPSLGWLGADESACRSTAEFLEAWRGIKRPRASGAPVDVEELWENFPQRDHTTAASDEARWMVWLAFAGALPVQLSGDEAELCSWTDGYVDFHEPARRRLVTAAANIRTKIPNFPARCVEQRLKQIAIDPPERLNCRSREVIYGINPVHRLLVFIRRQEVEGFAETWEILTQSKTWRALREAMPEWFEDRFRGGEYGEWDTDPPFDEWWPWDPEDKPQFDELFGTEGNWIPSVADELMMEWIPEEISEFAGPRTGDYSVDESICIPADREAEVIEAMQRVGFRCSKDQNAVQRAGGYRALGCC